MDVILIAAVTANGMIAHGPEEVVSWSEDLALFREQTMGETIIMGSKTAKTLATDLLGRETRVLHRDRDPEGILTKVKTGKCFVIGGARTFSRFAPFLTHLFVTYHPLIFSSDSLPLFSHLKRDMKLKFVRLLEVDANKGVYQFQYEVDRS